MVRINTWTVSGWIPLSAVKYTSGQQAKAAEELTDSVIVSSPSLMFDSIGSIIVSRHVLGTWRSTRVVPSHPMAMYETRVVPSHPIAVYDLVDVLMFQSGSNLPKQPL